MHILLKNPQRVAQNKIVEISQNGRKIRINRKGVYLSVKVHNEHCKFNFFCLFFTSHITKIYNGT